MFKSLALVVCVVLMAASAKAGGLKKDSIEYFSDSDSCQVSDFVTVLFAHPQSPQVVAWKAANVLIQGKAAEGLAKVLSQGSAKFESHPNGVKVWLGQNIGCHYIPANLSADSPSPEYYRCWMHIDQDGGATNQLAAEPRGGGSVKN